MAQMIDEALGNPLYGLIVAIVIVAVIVVMRLYFMRSGRMRAKCPKCGAIFDASHIFVGLHIGPLKMETCPACGKTSLMNTYVKDPITWPPNQSTQQQTAPKMSDEELKRKRIEDSKYERS